MKKITIFLFSLVLIATNIFAEDCSNDNVNMGGIPGAGGRSKPVILKPDITILNEDDKESLRLWLDKHGISKDRMYIPLSTMDEKIYLYKSGLENGKKGGVNMEHVFGKYKRAIALEKALQEKDNNTIKWLEIARQISAEQIAADIKSIIKDIGDANGYSVIINSAAMNRAIDVNLTSEVLKKLNERYREVS